MTHLTVLEGGGGGDPDELVALFASIPADATEDEGIAIISAGVKAAWQAGEAWAVGFIVGYIHERVVAHDLRYRNGLESP